MPALRFEEVKDQKQALMLVAQMIRKGSVNPQIIRAARAITINCEPRDELAELRAIYQAVKTGDESVEWLAYGMRYVSDPHPWDTFSEASAIVEDCKAGACAGDCDDSSILIGSLACALGFPTGVRAWGPGSRGDYQHVYCVAATPKSGPWPRDYYGHGLDTTVPRFRMGQEPGEGPIGKGPAFGHFMTAWVY
ncbi:MAG TPA: hypothetical protein VLY82_03180 [Nitrososphaerales archaeon]|nr:hypothetical protein [Nitrososphaerales archaeon]